MKKKHKLWHHNQEKEWVREHTVDDLISVHRWDTRRNCADQAHAYTSQNARGWFLCVWSLVRETQMVGVNCVAVTCNGYSITFFKHASLSPNSLWIALKSEKHRKRKWARYRFISLSLSFALSLFEFRSPHAAHIIECKAQHSRTEQSRAKSTQIPISKRNEAHIFTFTGTEFSWVSWLKEVNKYV